MKIDGVDIKGKKMHLNDCYVCQEKNLCKKKRRYYFCDRCKPIWKNLSRSLKLKVKNYGQVVLELDFSKCSICGFSHLVDIHHKDHNKSNNTKENLVVLCPNCHMLVHKKKMNLIQIKELMQKI